MKTRHTERLDILRIAAPFVAALLFQGVMPALARADMANANKTGSCVTDSTDRNAPKHCTDTGWVVKSGTPHSGTDLTATDKPQLPLLLDSAAGKDTTPSPNATTPKTDDAGSTNPDPAVQLCTNDVTQLYVTLLHRSPDPVGLADWVDECVKGMSVADMTTAFKKSCEYVGKQKTGYVDTATRTLIGGWATQNVDISIDGHVVAAGVRTSGKRADVIAVMGCSRTYGFNYVPPSLSAGAHTVSATISGTKVALPSSGQALTIPAL